MDDNNENEFDTDLDVEFKLSYLKTPFKILFFFIKNSRFTVLSYVANKAFYLRFASEDLKNDRNMVRTAVESGAYAIKYAGNEIKNDKEFIISMSTNYPDILHYLPKKLKSDNDINALLKSHSKPLINAEKEDIKSEAKKIGLNFLKYGAIVISLILVYGFSTEYYEKYKRERKHQEIEAQIKPVLRSFLSVSTKYCLLEDSTESSVGKIKKDKTFKHKGGNLYETTINTVTINIAFDEENGCLTFIKPSLDNMDAPFSFDEIDKALKNRKYWVRDSELYSDESSTLIKDQLYLSPFNNKDLVLTYPLKDFETSVIVLYVPNKENAD